MNCLVSCKYCVCSGGGAETRLTFLRTRREKRWGQITCNNLWREKASETGEEPDSCSDCPVTLGWLEVSDPSIHHHFPRKQLIPPELPQTNTQNRAKEWNLPGRVDTSLAKHEFLPRWSSNSFVVSYHWHALPT